MHRTRTPRTAVAGGGILTLLLVVPAASAADGLYPPSSLEVVSGTVSRGVVSAGQPVTFTGQGFAPGSVVRLSAEGVPEAVLRADGSGVVVATLRPRGAEGIKALAAAGARRNGEPLVVSVTIRLVSEGGTAATADRPTADVASGVALVAGFGLVASAAGIRLAWQFRRAGPARRRGGAA